MSPSVLSIGTTDPWNAAGLGLDIRVLAAFGVRPFSVVAAVSAQDRHGLARVEPVDPGLIAAQLAALRDAAPGAYRIGALPDAATIDIVAGHVAASRAPAVLDPVLGPSGGGRFGGAEARIALVRRLLPRVALVTPNLAEARDLVRIGFGDGAFGPRAIGEAGAEELGKALVALGAAAALVTDGDREPDVRDVLVDRDGVTEFSAARIPGGMRGTGCVLAAGIAAELARGLALRPAIESARAFVRAQIGVAEATGGMRLFAIGEHFIP